jgi:hypothetical protein
VPRTNKRECALLENEPRGISEASERWRVLKTAQGNNSQFVFNLEKPRDLMLPHGIRDAFQLGMNCGSCRSAVLLDEYGHSNEYSRPTRSWQPLRRIRTGSQVRNGGNGDCLSFLFFPPFSEDQRAKHTWAQRESTCKAMPSMR